MSEQTIAWIDAKLAELQHERETADWAKPNRRPDIPLGHVEGRARNEGATLAFQEARAMLTTRAPRSLAKVKAGLL